MNILVISSNYPPFHSGGYEIRISEVINELVSRGHKISVLTTRPTKKINKRDNSCAYVIVRNLVSNRRKTRLLDDMTRHSLTHAIGLLLIVIKELLADFHDLKIIDKAIKKDPPDIIYLGYILPLTRTLMPFLAGKNIPIVLDDGGATLVILNEDKGLWYRYIHEFSFLSKIKPIIIKFITFLSSQRLRSTWAWPENLSVLFKRETNREAAVEKKVPFKQSYVLSTGLDTELFSFSPRDRLHEPISIIYPGRVEPRKGQLDAIRLVAELSKNKISSELFLIGPVRPTFQAQIQSEVESLKFGPLVKFIPMIPHAELVEWYQKADLCFFPTYWKDGLSRVPLEAMACGAIIISYGNEGSNEVIENGKNGFLVEEKKYQLIVEIIRELVLNPFLVQDITQAARRNIESEYSLGVYVDRIENVLHGIIA